MRVVLSPRWLLGHVLVLALFAACLWLGWWQWTRAESPTGGAQNFGYALQWPLFAGFGLFFWTRVVRDKLRPRSARPAAGRAPARGPAARRAAAHGSGIESPRPLLLGAPAQPEPADPELADPGLAESELADPELAAYNRYLASLHAADQRS